MKNDLHVGGPIAIIHRLFAHRSRTLHLDVATATPNRIGVHEEKRTGPRAASGINEDIRLLFAHVFDQLHQRLALGFIFRFLIESIKLEHVDALIADKIKTHRAETREVRWIGQTEGLIFDNIRQVVLLGRCKADFTSPPPALRRNPNTQ